jgi:hypothetical protein
MQSEDDVKRYVEQTASLVGIALAPADLPSVLAVFMNLARVAEPLMAFSLPPETISAAIFSPKDRGDE